MGVLRVIELVISLLQPLLGSLVANPVYAGLMGSVGNAVAELEKARQEILTKAELEGLRTTPQW